MAQTALACTQGPRILGLLQAMEMQSPSLDITEAIVTLKTALHTDVALARAAYLRHLEKEPSLITATRWIAGEKLEDDAAKPLRGPERDAEGEQKDEVECGRVRRDLAQPPDGGHWTAPPGL